MHDNAETVPYDVHLSSNTLNFWLGFVAGIGAIIILLGSLLAIGYFFDI